MDSSDATVRAEGRRAPLAGWRCVFLVLGIWIFLGAFLGFQNYLNQPSHSITLAAALGHPIRRYLIYALLTFPCLWLCRRYPFPSRRWPASLLAHLGGLGAFMVLYAALRFVIGPPIVDAETGASLPATVESTWALIRSNLFEQFWMYTSIVTAVLAIQHYQLLRRRELREADLRRQMAEYELQVLKLQLHPHFLFNTLNGISTLMIRDTATAREMLLRLSDLLRVALARWQDNEVPLRDELDFVKAYLDLEQMRFGERLRVSLHIDPETLDVRVPNMLIQPLVENAIQYGIAQIRSGGVLELGTEILDGKMRVRIINDGPVQAIGTLPVKGSGVGLGNTRLRLEQIYGDAFGLDISGRKEGGAELRLEIPLRRSELG
ncbi:MAG TPA: histidine kinase [Candidatus Polarisedimenticolia bacterium]|nr:histidine kinase [Candidatus Polarisedimenticolia bacterium]